MEIKVQVTDSANATAQAKFQSASLDKRVDELAKKAAKKLKVDGFRPGKVPTDVVKKRYEKDLANDARQEFFKEMIDEALKELQKKPDDMIGEPSILKFEEKDDGTDVEIEISFRPKFELDGYEQVIPAYEAQEASKEEIKAKVDEFLKLVAPVEKSDKTTLEKGDFAKFDFEGSVDGEVFEGGSAKDFLLEIGSNQFIPGFEDGMVGLKVGEEKEINVTFPSEYQAKNLAGKESVFKVKLNEIHTKNIPQTADEELLKRAMPGEKEPSMEKLETRIKEQIQSDKFNQLLNDELKPKFVDAVVEKFAFDLPKNIVEQEIDVQFRNEWSKFTPDEMAKFREDKEALTTKRESYRQGAKKSVALTFIVDSLAKLREISVTDQELIQAIYMEAYRYGIEPKKHLEEYRNNGLLPAVKMAMIEDKLFNDLFKASQNKGK